MKKASPLTLVAFVTLCVIISCSHGDTISEPHSGVFSVSDSQKVVFAIENLKNADSELFSFNHYGNVPEGWRVLTAQEWQYLVLKRSNALNLTLWATVEGEKGVIFLPDNYNNALKLNHISPQSIKPWDDQIYLNTNIDPTTLNVFTQNQWTELSKDGAIFLPLNLGSEGGYWQTGDTFLSFNTKFIWPARGCATSAIKNGVRLAKDVEK